MAFWESLLAAGTQIFGINKAAESVEETNEANKQISEDTRQWEERMANSAHQRAVTDLKAAGLNPMLAANAGANVPTPPTPHMENASAAYSSGYNNVGQTISNAQVLKANVENLKEQTLTQKAMQNVNNAQAVNLAEEAKAKAMSNAVNAVRSKNEVAKETRKGSSATWLNWKTDVEDALDMINPFRNFSANQSFKRD